jgi:hypothetical protein
VIRLAIEIYTGIVRRFGFGGPWMKGKKTGQMSLFMVWDEEWYEGEVVHAWVIFDSRRFVGL